MKEFENWLEENGYGSIKDNHNNSCDNSFIMGLGAGWEAALEWVLKERKAWGDNHLKCVFDIIEQELKDA